MKLLFKSCFVLPIKAGTKIHTIRRDRSNKWGVGSRIDFIEKKDKPDTFWLESVGDELQIWVYDKPFKAHVKSTQKIHIIFELKNLEEMLYGLYILIDDKPLAPEDVPAFIKAEGFVNAQQFIRFFHQQYWHDADPQKYEFTGKLIHWTDKRPMYYLGGSN